MPRKIGGPTISSSTLPQRQRAKVRSFVKTFPRAHADVRRLLDRNRIFLDRCRGVGLRACLFGDVLRDDAALIQLLLP